MKKLYILVILILFSLPLWSQKPSKKDYLITISTEYGNMYAVLYDETPQHKANFIKLAKEKFYDGLLFHRIIESFMIQGGDPKSKDAQPGQPLGSGDVGYTVPAEFNDKFIHKKGVIAAARDNNPQKASSGCQFYIAQGKVVSEGEFVALESRSGKKLTDEQKQIYKTIGGVPHLDGSYTVYGEVIKGLDVLDSIAKQPKDPYDRPVKNISMKVTVQQLKKKKITKMYGYKFD